MILLQNVILLKLFRIQKSIKIELKRTNFEDFNVIFLKLSRIQTIY